MTKSSKPAAIVLIASFGMACGAYGQVPNTNDTSDLGANTGSGSQTLHSPVSHDRIRVSPLWETTSARARDKPRIPTRGTS
jgi:hypothetical protein